MAYNALFGIKKSVIGFNENAFVLKNFYNALFTPKKSVIGPF